MPSEEGQLRVLDVPLACSHTAFSDHREFQRSRGSGGRHAQSDTRTSRQFCSDTGLFQRASSAGRRIPLTPLDIQIGNPGVREANARSVNRSRSLSSLSIRTSASSAGTRSDTAPTGTFSGSTDTVRPDADNRAPFAPEAALLLMRKPEFFASPFACAFDTEGVEHRSQHTVQNVYGGRRGG